MRRGALCRDTITGVDSIDFLRTDWFALAPLTVEDARNRFCVPPKSPAAIAAGSVGPREPGGISPYQLNAGRQRARDRGEPYHAYGTSLP